MDFELKNEEFPFLVHRLSVIKTAYQYKKGVKNIQTSSYNDARTVIRTAMIRKTANWSDFSKLEEGFVTSSAVPNKRTYGADHSEEMPRNGIIKCFLGVVFIWRQASYSTFYSKSL